MRAALPDLLGEHDFAAFCASGSAASHTVRRIYRAELTAECETAGAYAGLITFRITGSGFLYHMVRNIVSTAVAVGTGRISQDRFAEIFAARERRLAPPTAPASGLYLLAVDYDGTSERSHTDGAGNAAASCDKCRT